MQWADVRVYDGGSSQLDKLRQIRSQNNKPILLQLGSELLVVKQKLGHGAFASVYQVCFKKPSLQDCTQFGRTAPDTEESRVMKQQM